MKSESKENVLIKLTEFQNLTTERRPTKYLRTFLSLDSEFYKLKMEGVALKWTKCTIPGCAKVTRNTMMVVVSLMMMDMMMTMVVKVMMTMV